LVLKFKITKKEIMKKYVFAVLTIFVGYSAFSQVKIGLKVAPNFSWSQTIPKNDVIYKTNESGVIDTLTVGPNGLKLRGGAGVIVDLHLSDNFAFATGVDYTTKGAGFKVNDSSVTYSLQYLEVPLTIKVFTNEVMDYTKVYFQIGITQNVNIGAKSNKSKTYKDPNDATKDIPFTKNINLLETSLLAGAGIEMEMGESTSLLAGLSYNRGLINIDATNTFKSPNKLANGYLAINVGLKF